MGFRSVRAQPQDQGSVLGEFTKSCPIGLVTGQPSALESAALRPPRQQIQPALCSGFRIGAAVPRMVASMHQVLHKPGLIWIG